MIEHDNGKISVRRQCDLLEINRSSLFYTKADEDARDLELMTLIDKQFLKTPYYGSRRMTQFLRKEGFLVNRKRIQRLMRLMGIEAIYTKPKTSKPSKEHKIYPYLLRGKTIESPDQVWCSDITYIPMRKGFLYLVAVMDWHSRYVISWRLSNSMDTTFCTDALDDALAQGKPEIFNTDQGSQFTSIDFTDILGGQGIQISMDGKGRYLDNIFIERLWRSLKYEEVYLKAYEDIKEARVSIAEWIRFYNFDRPHQALGYKTPWEIYQQEPRLAPEGSVTTTVITATSVAITTVAVIEDNELIQKQSNSLDPLTPHMVSLEKDTLEVKVHLSS
jgi:putative transposase